MTVGPWDWRVPIGGDAPDIPYDMNNLATDIAATLSQIVDPVWFSKATTGIVFSGAITGPTNYTIDYSAAGFTSSPAILLSWYEGQFGWATVSGTPAPTPSGATITVTPGGASVIPRVRWVALGN